MPDEAHHTPAAPLWVTVALLACIALGMLLAELWATRPAWQHATRRWRTHAIEHGRHPGGVVAEWTGRRRR